MKPCNLIMHSDLTSSFATIQNGILQQKKITKKISKIDRDLKHLEKCLPQGVVKETLMDEMKNQKRPLSRRINQELKRQKLIYTPTKHDEKVNFMFQLFASLNYARSCMRSL